MTRTRGTTLSDQKTALNVLYIGPQKHGKTSDMAAMAKLGPVAYIDFESGLKAQALKKLGVPIDMIEVFKPKNYDGLLKLYWDLAADLDKDPDSWAGVSLDSVTDQQGVYLEHSVNARVEKERSKNLDKQNPELLDSNRTLRDDYGVWTNQARKLARKFRDLPCHTAFGSLERREVTGQGVKLVPQITQAFRCDLLGYVDMIVHKVMAENEYSPNPDGIEYLGIMRSVGVYSGGDRFAITPRVLANPTVDRLVGLLEGTLNLDEDPHQLAYLRRMSEKTGKVAPSVAQASDAPKTKEGDSGTDDDNSSD